MARDVKAEVGFVWIAAALSFLWMQPVFGASPLAQSLPTQKLRAQNMQSLSAIEIVNRMVQSEAAAWKNRQHFAYQKEEKSNRTKGHLWTERVVETDDGPMERLIREDGTPLPTDRGKAEERRITYLAQHPEELRHENKRREADESRMPELLKELPKIFLFRIVGAQDACARIAFQPNPTFHEQSYQDRVVHAMSGEMRINMAEMRLSRLDVHLGHRVEFGFGLLGEVSDKTHFSLVRAKVAGGQWKTTEVAAHLDGTILLLKSISRDVDSTEHDFKAVAHNLTVAQAAAMVRADGY